MSDNNHTDSDVAALVSELLNEKVLSLVILSSGQNNQSFKAKLNSHFVVVKKYFQHPLDPRDRLGHEWGFLSYLWGQGLRCIPEPVAVNFGEKIACYSYLPGEPFSGRVSKEDVDTAGRFYADCNAARSSPEAGSLPIGAEAFFSIAEHLSRLRERITALVMSSPPVELHEEYADLCVQLQFLADSYEKWVRQRDPSWEILVPEQLRFLSPSDFGFHNVIRSQRGELYFLDFEYAGWDDPGRTVCDVFLQPRIPVPEDFKPTFLQAAFSAPDVRRDVAERAASLLPLTGLRWCCILLNVFSDIGAERRKFARKDTSDQILGEKLRLARDRAVAVQSLLTKF